VNLQDFRRWYYQGYISVNSATDSIGLPFLGFKGDYTQIPFLPTQPAYAPKLYFTTDNSLVPANQVYDIDYYNTILLIYSYNRPALQFSIDLVNASDNSLFGYINYFSYSGTNPLTPLTYSSYEYLNSWVYTDKNGHIKNLVSGSYKIRISALKFFGNPNNPDDFEKWYSIPFTIRNINYN